MARPRACDACSVRKVGCTGHLPCPNCIRTGFQCLFTRRSGKPGPKGPHRTTRARVNQQSQIEGDNSPARASPSPTSPNDAHACSIGESPQLSPAPPKCPTEWEKAFTLADVLSFLETYDERMYPVWPVIDVTRVTTAFRHEWGNAELCALVFAVCASTSAQLRYNSYAQGRSAVRTPPGGSCMILEDRFAVEAERYRSKYDYRESTTTEAILIPLFLHFYYGAKGKKRTTSFLLQEAVTLCRLMDLDKEEKYRDLNPEDENYRRRIFWLLYVTERGHAMQHGTPICLTKSIGLPSNDGCNKPHVLEAFNCLIHLFSAVDGVLVDPEADTKRQGQKYSMEVLSQLQHKLRPHDQWPLQWTEAQRSDIAMTQQWLRILVWQLSLRNVSMSSESADDSMSFTYPAHVSKDALRSISTVRLDALLAHGPGMQQKISDIAASLLDVLTCVHSIRPEILIQARQTLHEFCCYLVKLNHNREDLDWLRKRLTDSNVLFQHVRELPAISDIAYDETDFASPAPAPSNS